MNTPNALYRPSVDSRRSSGSTEAPTGRPLVTLWRPMSTSWHVQIQLKIPLDDPDSRPPPATTPQHPTVSTQDRLRSLGSDRRPVLPAAQPSGPRRGAAQGGRLMTTSPTPMRRRCPICTTSFTPHPRKRAQTYCTERCRQIAYRRRRAEARTDDPPTPTSRCPRRRPRRRLRAPPGSPSTAPTGATSLCPCPEPRAAPQPTWPQDLKPRPSMQLRDGPLVRTGGWPEWSAVFNILGAPQLHTTRELAPTSGLRGRLVHWGRRRRRPHEPDRVIPA